MIHMIILLVCKYTISKNMMKKIQILKDSMYMYMQNEL